MGCTGLLHLLFSLFVFSNELQVTRNIVVQTNSACLKEYFFKGIPPIYFNRIKDEPLNPLDKFICQELNGITYFVTRYSTELKIPIYCAYQIKSLSKRSDDKFKWVNESALGDQQASNENYNKSGYDRGHLNPRSHNMNSSESIKVTYTLTNAVPMTRKDNLQWYHFAELPLYKKMKAECDSTNAIRYVITGVVPGQQNMNGTGVNIPEYVWSAACCVKPNGGNVWSVGYLMSLRNQQAITYGNISIQDLQEKLKHLLDANLNVNVMLFRSTCGPEIRRPQGSCIKPPKAGKIVVRGQRQTRQ